MSGESELLTRRCAICKVDWYIENSIFLLRSGECNVYSGDFSMQAIPFVEWRIHLKVENDESKNCVNFSVHLAKVPFSITLLPEIITMHVSVTAGEKTYQTHTTCYDLRARRGKQKYLPKMPDIWQDLSPFTPDTLKIQCYLIIRKKEKLRKLPVLCPTGLLRLSKDLQSLISCKHTDIMVIVGNKNIKAHKCILSRNTVFNEYIKKANVPAITLPNLDYQAVREFINFLYSGNMDLVLANNSIAMVKCMEHFNSDVLNSYYALEEIKMTTKLNCEKNAFNWGIGHFYELKINETIDSPPIKKHNENTTWKLSVSMKRKKQKTNETDDLDYISIFAEIIEGDKPPFFCLEFGIARGEKIHFCKKLLRYKDYKSMGFENFVSKKALTENSFIVANTLRIAFKVRTSDFREERTVGCSTMSFVTSTYESSYEELSLQMEQLLKEKRYSDITVTDGRESFEAHKCVLAARSPVLSQKIEDMQPDNHILNLRDVMPKFFKFIVHYIYTGILKDIDPNDLESLKSIAENLSIEGLQEECTRQLESRSSEVNDAME